MTENSIFGTSPDDSQPPNGDHEDPDDGGAAGANRRKLFIAGGVAGVAVLAIAAFMLLHGGSSTSNTAATGAVPHGTVKTPAVAASAPSSAGTKKTRLPKKGKVQAGRDPFAALYTAPVTTGTAVGTTTTVGSTPAPDPTTSAPVTGPTSTPVPVPTSPTVGPLGAPTYVQLLSTKGTQSATFRVGYAHHKFKQFAVEAPAADSSTGTVFANDFALIKVKSGHIATVQIGDGPPFDLGEGVARQV
jgi:hypothetical protein